RLAAREGVGQRVGIVDVAVPRRAGAGVVVGMPGHGDDLVARLLQRPTQALTDEAGGSGDEDSHDQKRGPQRPGPNVPVATRCAARHGPRGPWGSWDDGAMAYDGTSSSPRSPLLGLPGAVAGDGIDAPVAAHYGSFTTEQRTLAAGEGFVDLSHRGVVRISGPDRLTWLHSLTSQHLLELAPGEPTATLVLSPQGHVEHALYGTDDGEAFTAPVEPGRAPALVEWIQRMIFMSRVEVADATAELAVAWRPAKVTDAPYSGYDLVPRAELEAYAAAAGPACGLWAFEALRIARGEARWGLDTDERTIPNEAGWVGPAVHLDKGCYRGQETVARVHTLGRPPRRLTLLHLDGSDPALPP